MRELLAISGLAISPTTPIWVAAIIGFAAAFLLVSGHIRRERRQQHRG